MAAARKEEAKGQGHGKMAVIDGTDLVLGRMASAVAKRLLNGESISIINAEKVVIVGGEEDIVGKFRKKLELNRKGNPEQGPKESRMPDKMVRRAIRGMLPHKRERGAKAFRNLKVFIGIPRQIEGEKPEGIAGAENHAEHYVYVGEMCRKCGARW